MTLFTGRVGAASRDALVLVNLQSDEVLADQPIKNLKKADWSLGLVSAIDSEWRMTWIVAAHRDDGKRFVVRADEMLDCVSGIGSGDPTRSTQPPTIRVFDQ